MSLRESITVAFISRILTHISIPMISFRHEHLPFYLEQTLALLHLHQAEEVAKVHAVSLFAIHCFWY